MNLKRFGGGCIALGILLSLVALAQPATVADTSTTCIDTWSYGQECSTVQYERPNHARSQLFGVGVFSTFLGLFVYGVGATRGESSSAASSASRSGSAGPRGGAGRRSDGPEHRSDGPEPRSAGAASQSDGPGSGAGGTPGDTTPLHEQLEARTEARNRSSSASTGPTTEGTDADAAVDGAAPGAGDAGAPTSDRATTSPAPGTDPGSAAVEGTGSTAGDRRLGAVAGAAASGLASAFALTWLVGLVATVESAVVRALAFAAFALPGIALYGRYRADEPAEADPDEEATGR